MGEVAKDTGEGLVERKPIPASRLEVRHPSQCRQLTPSVMDLAETQSPSGFSARGSFSNVSHPTAPDVPFAEVCRAFYEQDVAPLLADVRHAAALIGPCMWSGVDTTTASKFLVLPTTRSFTRSISSIHRATGSSWPALIRTKKPCWHVWTK